MFKKTFIAMLASAAMLAPAAFAQTELYGSLGVSALDGDDATLTAATLRGGAFFTENFGAEVEANFGVGGETVDGVELDLSQGFGIYGVGRLPMNESFDLLARIGYSTNTIEGTIPGLGSADVDVDGFGFGVGAQYFFIENFGVRADYTRFETNEDDFDGGLDIFTISAVYRFGG